MWLMLKVMNAKKPKITTKPKEHRLRVGQNKNKNKETFTGIRRCLCPGA